MSQNVKDYNIERLSFAFLFLRFRKRSLTHIVGIYFKYTNVAEQFLYNLCVDVFFVYYFRMLTMNFRKRKVQMDQVQREKLH